MVISVLIIQSGWVYHKRESACKLLSLLSYNTKQHLGLLFCHFGSSTRAWITHCTNPPTAAAFDVCYNEQTIFLTGVVNRTKVPYFFHPLLHFSLLSLKLPPLSFIQHPPTDVPSHVSNLKNSTALPGIKEGWVSSNENAPLRMTTLGAFQSARAIFLTLSVCLNHWHNKMRFISPRSHIVSNVNKDVLFFPLEQFIFWESQTVRHF